MFVKALAKSIRLKKLEVLSFRIPESHPKIPEITQDLIKLKSGFKGERTVSYYLEFLPEKETFIFHNLRLSNGKHYFQIDFLIITQHSAFILECKNFFGELYFDNIFKQLVRTTSDQEEGFPDPISQVKWHQKQLYRWLNLHNFAHFPIHSLVVMSNPSAILKRNPDDIEVTKMVVKTQNLIERMEEMGSKHSIDHKEIKKLCKLLLKSNTPENPDLLKYYGINKSEVLTGVQCPECRQLVMIRHKKKWFCEKCQTYSKDAHEKAVEDYLLTIDSTITNQEFRLFTHLSSVYTANRHLNSMNLVRTGTKKGCRYSLK